MERTQQEGTDLIVDRAVARNGWETDVSSSTTRSGCAKAHLFVAAAVTGGDLWLNMAGWALVILMLARL